MAYIGVQPTDTYLSIASQQITGNGGATYTLDYSVSNEEDVAVFVNNVRQNVNTYTVSGTSLTLGGTISASDSCWVLFLGRTVGTKTPAVGSVTNDMLAGSISPSKVSNLYPYRNLIINGDMSIAQRGTSFTCSNATGSKYTLDRFEYIDVDTPDSVYTITPSTDVPSGKGFVKSLKVDVATADASLDAADGTQIQTKLEAQNLQHLKIGTSSAESLTLSFWVKSNKTGTYVVRLTQPDDGSRMVSYAYTISSASTWEKKTISITADTGGNINNDNGVGLNVTWWLSAGTNYQSGSLASTWQAYSNGDSAVGQVNLADSTSNEWYITGVQLEVGTSASDFEFLPYDVNLERCERYFERLHREATTTERVSIGWFNTTTNLQAEIHYKEKRTQPSITINNVGNFRVNYLNSATTPSGASGNTIGKKKSTIAWTVSGMTAGQGGGVRTDTTSATIDVDAEL